MCVRYYNIRSRKENMNACVMAINHISGFTPQMTSDKEKKTMTLGGLFDSVLVGFVGGFLVRSVLLEHSSTYFFPGELSAV